MADIRLTQGERYTFAKVNTVPVIIDSTDGAEDINNFRNEVHVTRDDDEMITLTNSDDSIGSDVMLTFSSSYADRPDGNWTIGLDARKPSPTRYHNFVINNAKNSFSGTPALIISSSNQLFIDYDILPTSDPVVKGQLFRQGTALHVSAG